jgi:hypothetical protein
MGGMKYEGEGQGGGTGGSTGAQTKNKILHTSNARTKSATNSKILQMNVILSCTIRKHIFSLLGIHIIFDIHIVVQGKLQVLRINKSTGPQFA